jgi:hypothetical protein
VAAKLGVELFELGIEVGQRLVDYLRIVRNRCRAGTRASRST